MGGVGDELPPRPLRLLEAVHQVVELPGDLGELVVAGDDRPLVVGPLPHAPDGVEEVRQAGGDLPAEDQAQHQHQHRHAHGDGHEVVLQSQQQ